MKIVHQGIENVLKWDRSAVKKTENATNEWRMPSGNI